VTASSFVAGPGPETERNPSKAFFLPSFQIQLGIPIEQRRQVSKVSASCISSSEPLTLRCLCLSSLFWRRQTRLQLQMHFSIPSMEPDIAMPCYVSWATQLFSQPVQTDCNTAASRSFELPTTYGPWLVFQLRDSDRLSWLCAPTPFSACANRLRDGSYFSNITQT
jgi:hypothetical protein